MARSVPNPESRPSGEVRADPAAAGSRPEPGGPRVDPTQADATAVLDRRIAGAVADPAADTQVVDVAGVGVRPGGRRTAGRGDGAAGLAPLLGRRVAAEVGMYVGAGLVALSLVGVAARGWPEWGTPLRVGALGLAALGLLASGLFVRLPWTRAVGDERRRAVSTMLTAGVGLGLAALGVLGSVGEESSGAGAIGHAALCVVAMIGVCAVARTPFSELALLAALVWAVWLVAPPGTATWATLVGLGILWMVLAARVARGRRTAAVSGAVLALVASVVLAQGEWAWPVRGVLAAVVIVALVMFGRGGPNYWLALGAGAAAALAAAVAGGVLGPALALFIGGLATMVVSGIALRAATPRPARTQAPD